MNGAAKPVSTFKTPKLGAVGRMPRRRRAVVSQAHAGLNDEIEIARRRMHHLLYRNVEPLPTMHFVVGKDDQNLTAAQRATYQQIALCVLALQMWQATAKSALR